MPRPYHNSLFSCSTAGSLLEACCCPCVVYGRNHSRIVHGNREDYSSCNPWCIAWCCLCCCGNWGWVLQIIDRKDMQKKHSTLITHNNRDWLLTNIAIRTWRRNLRPVLHSSVVSMLRIDPNWQGAGLHSTVGKRGIQGPTEYDYRIA